MSAMSFSEEQNMLLETALNFCRERSSLEAVRNQINEADALSANNWQAMAELGWLGIAVPEEYGGLGMGLGSTVPVAEAMGRYLIGGPFFGTTLAIQALVTSGDEAQKNDYLPGLASGTVGAIGLNETDGNWSLTDIEAKAERQGEKLMLSGAKCFVQDLPLAAVVVVSVLVDGEARLLLLEREQLDNAQYDREVVLDETRRSYTLTLDGIEAPVSQLLPGCDFASLENAAMLLLCAEASGGMTAVLQIIVEYLNTRKAFDQYIGAYQSLKHPSVEILLAQEAAKSLVYEAASIIDANADEHAREVALRMAKAHASEAFAFAGDRAIQFHGGFGFTYECDAQLFLRRALWCQYQFGDEKHQRRLLAPLMFDQGGLDQAQLEQAD